MSVLRVQHIGTSITDFKETDAALTALGFETRDFRNDQGKGFQYDSRVLLGNECWLHIVHNWNPDSRVAQFEKRHGQALEHIAIQSDDIEADVAHVNSLGIPIFEDTIFNANDGFEAFVYPKDGIGFTVELIQPHDTSWQYPEDATGKPVSSVLEVRRADELGVVVSDPPRAAQHFVKLFPDVQLAMNESPAPLLLFANGMALRLLDSESPTLVSKGVEAKAFFDQHGEGLAYLSLETAGLDSDRKALDSLSFDYQESGGQIYLDPATGARLPLGLSSPSR